MTKYANLLILAVQRQLILNFLYKIVEEDCMYLHLH